MAEKRTESGTDSKAAYPDSLDTKQLFITSVIGMSWQMALAILVPVVIGYFLDRKFNSAPLITMIGLFIGVLMVVGIVWRTVKRLPDFAKTKKAK